MNNNYTYDGDATIWQAKTKIKYHAKPSLLKHCEKFDTVFKFAKHVNENGKFPDYLAIKNVPFTMEEYDNDGQVITWTNKKLDLTVELTHENRYHNPKHIKSVIVYQPHCFRNDISFLE